MELPIKHITNINTDIAAWALPYWKLGLCFSPDITLLSNATNKPEIKVGTPQAKAIWKINISDKRLRYQRPRNLPYMAIISIQSINYDIEGIAKK